jgi:hypothetical protein
MWGKSLYGEPCGENPHMVFIYIEDIEKTSLIKKREKTKQEK